MQFAHVAIAGMLLAGGVGCRPASAGSDEVRTVVVEIRHSRFSPEQMTFSRGDKVRFVIRNTDPIDHEFILGDEEVQARHEFGTDAEHGTIPGEVTILAGDEGSTTYAFDRRGTLIYGCHLPGHYGYGMRGTVRTD